MNDARNIILLFLAFFALAAMLAVIASLEKILGRPIPRLRHSRPVSKNRVFWAVPAMMAAVIVWLWPRLAMMIACSHCIQPHLWQQTDGIVEISIFVLGLSAAAGWIVYYLLLLCTLVARLFAGLTRTLSAHS